MRAWIPILLAATCLTVAPARAQISIQVTHTETNFDVRAVDPAGTAYALNLSRGSSEIWASTDNARTWAFRGRHPLGYDFKTMTALLDGTLLADVQSGTNFFIARSTDHGVTWTNVLSLGGYRLLTPHSIDQKGGTTYLAEYQAFTGSDVPVRLWASTDSGATWTVRQTFTGHRHAHGIRVSPDGSLWIFFGDSDTGSGTFRSTDDGLTWTPLVQGQEGRINDALFVGNDALFGQDIPSLPSVPKVAKMTPEGVLTPFLQLPGPSYSIHRVPSGGFLLGTTRESGGDVYPPGDVSAHLFGSADGVKWIELGSYPRIDATDYARADVYWILPSGEAVLNLRHVTTLSSGRGYQLLKVSVGTPSGSTSFSDNFDTCTSDTNLGPNWTINGRWYCRSQRARGETAGGTAVANTALLQDTDVAALVQLNSSTGSGLVARLSPTGYYAVRLVAAGRIEIIKVTSSGTTILGSVAATVADVTSYRMRLTVTGTSPVQLEAFREGVSVLKATDASASILASGQAGLLAGGPLVSGTFFRTQYDDFSVTGTTGTTPPPPPSGNVSFSDNFDLCTSDVNLGPRWIINGRWYCRSQRARGETSGGTAVADTALIGDTDVAALVQLNSSTGSGLVARLSPTGYYAVRLLRAGRIEIIKVTTGGTTILGSVAATVADVTSYRMRLTVKGTAPVQLEAFREGVSVLTATDASGSFLASGQAGLLSGGPLVAGTFFRTQFDDFVLTGTTGTTPPPPPATAFSDNFDTCTSDVDLGPNWIISGRWYCRSQRARGETANGTALVAKSLAADQVVKGLVQLNGTAQGSGLVARAAAGHFYAVRVFTNRLEIVRFDNGSATVLATVPGSFPVDVSSTLTLKVTGTTDVQLEASVNGTPVVSATDSSADRLTNGTAGLLSGGGTAGTFFRTQYDNFSVAAP